MSTKTVTMPSKLETGEWTREEISYDEIIDALKHNIDAIPEIIKALKDADNKGWQQILDEMSVYVDSKPELAALVRRDERDGREALAIGEPNWIYAPLLFALGAFSAGFMIGTVCVAADPCMLVRTSTHQP